jgi:RND family efflux transporter MFP subunit
VADDPRAYEPERPGRRFVVGLVAATAAVAIAAGAVVLVRRAHTRREAAARAERARAPRRVVAVRVDRAPRQAMLRLPGEIRGFTETQVYAKIAGYLKRVVVDKGDRVRAGDLLAELESPELDHQVRNAEANYDLKRVTDERFQALRRDGVVSQQEADQAHADVAQAKASLEELRALQRYERITAEFDGIVTARYLDPGTLVPQATTGSLAASTAVVAMATLSPLRVYVDVPQLQAPFVRDGDEAVVTVTEYPGRRFPASVTRHPEALAPATRTMRVEVDLPNEDRALLPGMYAQITIEVSGRPAAPRVPDDTLIFRDGRTWVPVVDAGRLRVVPVTLGYDDGRESEVVDGLAGDELIATDVGQTARDGEPVEVRQAARRDGTAPSAGRADGR